MNLNYLATPALVLDSQALKRNSARMSDRMRSLGVDLRPHIKTAKSVDVAKLATAGHSGALTVSTLKEAEYFVDAGFRDILYAVGIVPEKLDEVARLQRRGAEVHVLTDSVEVAQAIGHRAQALDVFFNVFIEIDSGLHRAGIAADSPALLDIATALRDSTRCELKGVLTHAGHSYRVPGEAAIAAVAEEERAAVVFAASRLRDAGFACPVVSAGSTPTATFARSLEGVTEMRPGVYVFHDLYQSALGVCAIEDIAISVLATVIGHKPEQNQLLLDAGGLALSLDLGASRLIPNTGYGFVCDVHTCKPIPGLYVAATSQEHGWVTRADGRAPFDELPIGSKVRVLPSHACMTAAAYNRYHVVDNGIEIVAEWGRVNGW